MVRTDESNKVIVEFSNSDLNILFVQYISQEILPFNLWTQVYVVVERSKGVEAFFNGVSQGFLSKDTSGIDIGNGLGLNLGYNQTNVDEWFHGKLDEVKIFRVLVTQE